jgi:taurine dioxygenase
MMRARPASPRAPLTPQQRAKKPPVSQPIFRTHPITGRTVLYCNPGYATRIDGMADAQSAELLQFLFAHQEQEKYFYAPMDGWRRADVGQYRHGTQRRRRLSP